MLAILDKFFSSSEVNRGVLPPLKTITTTYSVKEFLAHCGPGKLGGIIVKVDRIRGTMYEICCQIWTVFSGDLPKKMTSLAPNTMWMADWVKCSVLLASVRVDVGTFGAYLFSVSYALLSLA